MKYLVTKVFIGGMLKGITITEETSVKFQVGFVCRITSGGSPYRIASVVEL
jgi:hypothetical protein